ncbi:carboxypeptidase-like regulatory domain-containing protein [Aequorivita marina]|uniref:carboxypeptidase-like regulatory domain-containing protein n=1 Tax=Aequorivita marina TaxID=3073654 RepID=UPI0028761DA8|nr:carboxypeptidase-like regulatory domain-containing protein [Aequorivita sp. S2608]MDS1299361.1 carboxypeptidase-like regulatory domain-containing protein [Aequorivita sp. S2608]
MKRKHITQIILVMGILLLFQSCELKVMDDRRVLIKGSVVDSSNNPIANISVRSMASGEILGETYSHTNGSFQFTSLEAENNYGVSILVNMNPNNNYNEGNIYDRTEDSIYSAKKFYSNSSKRNATTYNLGKIQLNKTARLDVFFNNVAGDNNSVAYKFEYVKAICDINLDNNNTEDCYYNANYYQQLDINTLNFQTNLYSQLGTTVILKYILNNEPEQVIEIPLTNTENNYVFEF